MRRSGLNKRSTLLEVPPVAGNFGANKGLIKEVRRYESFTVTVVDSALHTFHDRFLSFLYHHLVLQHHDVRK